MKTMVQALALAGALGAGSLALSGAATPAQAQPGPVCSVWLVESGRFMNVPYGSFMPDRAFVPGSTSPMHNINTVDLPDNIGVIKCSGELILYDSGWKQTEYHKMTGFAHFTPLPEMLKSLGFDAGRREEDHHRPRPLGSRRAAVGFPECHAVCATRGIARRRVGAELPEPAYQRREQYPWRLLPLTGLRL